MTPDDLDRIISAAVSRALAERQPDPIAVDPEEAARLLGISRRHFDDHVLPHLAYTRSGKRIIIPVAELHRYLDGVGPRQDRRQTFAAALPPRRPKG